MKIKYGDRSISLWLLIIIKMVITRKHHIYRPIHDTARNMHIILTATRQQDHSLTLKQPPARRLNEWKGHYKTRTRHKTYTHLKHQQTFNLLITGL